MLRVKFLQRSRALRFLQTEISIQGKGRGTWELRPSCGYRRVGGHNLPRPGPPGRELDTPAGREPGSWGSWLMVS